MRKRVERIRNSDFRREDELVTDRTLFAINFLINELREKYNIGYDEVSKLITERQEQLNLSVVPLEIFSERPLGILECIVKFLREERGMSLNQIAKMLLRDNRTIWSSYNNSLKKKKTRFGLKKTRIAIPTEIFRDRSTGLLESLSIYLRDRRRMSFHQIGVALNRDERTIWTSYNKGKKKGKGR
ncbi:hypothetical protein JXA85_04605 [Candidatus Woesearchaeota archaeon]|nr:hypothetical protein [Candidatus Woesearchaeota archaeon]